MRLKLFEENFCCVRVKADVKQYLPLLFKNGEKENFFLLLLRFFLQK